MLLKATILPIQSSDLAFYWPFVAEYVQEAVERSDGEIDLQQVFADIANHDRQLWIVKHDGRYIAAVVTQIYTTHTGIKIGEITMAGGSQHDLWDFFPEIIADWMKSQGCVYQDIIGRKGWERKYRDKGFRVAYQQLRRNL